MFSHQHIIIKMRDFKQNEYEIPDMTPDTPSVCKDVPVFPDVLPPLEVARFDDLTTLNFYGYGLGHFFNDLTASFWFNFAIYYLVTVVSTKAAGFAFLMGQLADALTTPLAGYASDNIKTRVGQRTFWYTVGFLICVISFPMIFRNMSSISETGQYLYYGGFASLFNFGWAFGQISHLSLVPALSCSKLRRERLNNLRNTFTYAANFLFLSLLSVLFSVVPDYSRYFFQMAVLVVLLGSITSIFFICVTDETNLTECCQMRRANIISRLPEELRESDREQRGNFRWSFWLKQYRFYLFGLAYICARLSVNMMATLLPFYIKAKGDTRYTTYIILLLYFCSIITSANTSRLSLKIGRNRSLVVGVACSLLASFLLYGDPQSLLPMLFAASFVGVSQAIIINSVVNFICEVIGARSERGASVFGIYSFLDKIITGLAIFFATLDISDSRKLQLTILLVPPSLGFMSCIWVWLARNRSMASVDILQEEVARTDDQIRKVLEELVM